MGLFQPPHRTSCSRWPDSFHPTLSSSLLTEVANVHSKREATLPYGHARKAAEALPCLAYLLQVSVDYLLQHSRYSRLSPQRSQNGQTPRKVMFKASIDPYRNEEK